MKLGVFRIVLLHLFAQPWLVNGQEDGYPLRGHDGGSCKEYANEGAVCSEFLGGMQVFEFDDLTLEAWDAILAPLVQDLIVQTQAIATQECFDAFLKMLCMSWYPPCDENNQPRRVCDEVCTEVNDEICSAAFAIARSLGQGASIPECDRNIGDRAGNMAFAYWEYLSAWNGTDMFPSVTEDPTCADLTVSKTGSCKKKNCKYPLAEYRVPKMKNPLNGLPEWKNPNDTDYCKMSVHTAPDDFDCGRCDSYCAFPCEPYPEVYTTGEYAILHVITFAPGFLALPLNIIVAFAEYKKIKALKKWNFTDTFIMISALLSMLLFIIEPLPSAIFGKEMRCNYEDVYNFEYDLQQEHDFCRFGKIRLHILQALLFCVVGTLYKVFRQLRASLMMSRYTPSQEMRLTFIILVILFPLILASFTYALDSDQLYELSPNYRIQQGGPPDLRSLHTANRLRYAFTCGPRFSTVLEELLIIHFPLLAANIVSMFLSMLLLHLVFSKMGAGKSSGKNNSALRNLALNMIRFAVITNVLGIINLVATVRFVPQSVDFGFKLNTWASCATTGINYEAMRQPDGTLAGNLKDHTRNNLTTLDDFFEHCGHFDDMKPSLILLILIALSNGLPPLAFGFVFALPTLKQFRQSLLSKAYRVAPNQTEEKPSTALAK